MKDLYYSSNQQRNKKYLEENRLRELNQEIQQQTIDNELAQKYGLEQQATNIGSLTNRVINKLLAKDAPPLEQTFSTPILTDSINNGYLTDIFDILKSSYKVLNNPTVKYKFNNMIDELIKENTDAKTIARELEGALKEDYNITTKDLNQAINAYNLDKDISINQEAPASSNDFEPIFTNRINNTYLTNAPPIEEAFTPILTDSINNGYLTDIFNILKSSYKSLNNPTVKDEINETIATMTEQGVPTDTMARELEDVLKEDLNITTEDLNKANQIVQNKRGRKADTPEKILKNIEKINENWKNKKMPANVKQHRKILENKYLQRLEEQDGIQITPFK